MDEINQSASMGLQASRETEVSRQMNRLRETCSHIDKLSEELIQRLSSVLSPSVDSSAKQLENDIPVSTPLASNINEQVIRLQSVEKKLRMILSGCEL